MSDNHPITPGPGASDAIRRAGRGGAQGSLATALVTLACEIFSWQPSTAATGAAVVVVGVVVSWLQNHLENIGTIPALFYSRYSVTSKTSILANTVASPPGPAILTEQAATEAKVQAVKRAKRPAKKSVGGI